MFETANVLEAALWTVIGATLAAAGLRPGRHRTLLRVSAAAFLAFGVSDLVETRTGAWWRPWWLLMWKAACIAVLLACLLRYRAARLREPAGGPTRRID